MTGDELACLERDGERLVRLGDRYLGDTCPNEPGDEFIFILIFKGNWWGKEIYLLVVGLGKRSSVGFVLFVQQRFVLYVEVV